MMIVARRIIEAVLAVLHGLRILLPVLDHRMVEELLLIEAVRSQYKVFEKNKKQCSPVVA